MPDAGRGPPAFAWPPKILVSERHFVRVVADTADTALTPLANKRKNNVVASPGTHSIATRCGQWFQRRVSGISDLPQARVPRATPRITRLPAPGSTDPRYRRRIR